MSGGERLRATQLAHTMSRAARSNVSAAARLEGWPMAEEQFDEFEESRLQALIKMEVACRLALESLPELPRETEEALREPIDSLCKITGREIERLRPGLIDRPSETS
jgi:hypothetical protein